MNDMIPAVKEGYFPPRNRAERKPAFTRTIAASFATDDDYVYSFTDDAAPRRMVPLSLSEMLASPIDIIHEEAEAPHAPDPQLASHAMTSLDRAAHRTDTLPEHRVNQDA
jgi:hypothetical protein